MNVILFYEIAFLYFNDLSVIRSQIIYRKTMTNNDQNNETDLKSKTGSVSVFAFAGKQIEVKVANDSVAFHVLYAIL